MRILNPNDTFRERVSTLREGGKRNSWKVFSDFCELSYCAVAKITAQTEDRREELEARYMKCVGQYNREQAGLFSDMLGCAVLAHEKPHEFGFQDFLGTVYEELELCNDKSGQVFTPWHLCQSMSSMTFSNIESLSKTPVMTLADPCSGSGRLSLSAADYIQSYGRNVSKELWVDATDLDVVCMQMTFLQFSLAGIPAVVHHGNTISQEMVSSSVTPNGVRLINESEYLRSWIRGDSHKAGRMEDILDELPDGASVRRAIVIPIDM